MMNNIIRHINYQGFTEILGEESLKQFIKEEDGPVCVFFITQWSTPSRLTYKRIKKASCMQKRIGFSDTDLVDNIGLCQKYKIEKVPHCLVFEGDKIVLQFVGLDIQKLNEVIQKYAKLQGVQLDEAIQNCPNGHSLENKSVLKFPPYIQNYFYCNSCKKIDQCSEQNRILHCQQCDYDICHICWKKQSKIKS